MTTKYSEEFKADNPVLPQLREVVEESVKGSNLSQEQIDAICKNVGALILETVPELVFTNMSDSFLFEGGFEECTKQSFINLKNIGIEKK
ncbi:MAG: hypothetical protein A2481_02455 [Candidatus Yonathbacteria bacterium RIFOXYC2_FULL_47_9]|nr:MAG: hypothetical protein A2481_02455 [Candidatus Yonathbacteria bacterium RIFOXYC2_FULL_47_9]HAT68560.1 hypothetical protein [Candidatus Yonathbacteria bacterium]